MMDIELYVELHADICADVAAFDSALKVVQLRRLTDGGEIEALVQDGRGQYRWPWLKCQTNR